MSVRYVSLKALQRSHSQRSETPESSWPHRLLADDAGSPSRARPIRTDPEHMAQILGATTKTNQYGDYLSVRCWCAQPPRYSPDSRALKLLSPEAPDEIADAGQWLFLDTETTGLAGGSGTYAFLVGIAWWEGGGLEIEQFFLREYSEERALLFALRERIAEHPVLVTFNGKSFDWPLLETRYRMCLKISAPTPRAHLDFLHGAEPLAAATWVRTAVRTRTPRVGLGPGSRPSLRFNSTNPLRLFARRSTGTAGSGTQPQPNGPAWTGSAVPPDSFPAQRRRKPRARWPGTVRCLPHLRKTRGVHASSQALREVDRVFFADGNRSSGATLPCKARQARG